MWAVLTIAVGTLAAASACREEAPAPRFNRNLGTADLPLMPPPKPTIDDSLLRHRADGIAPLADLNAATPADAADQNVEADRKAIAALIDRMRSATREKDFDALADLMVERQREVAKASVAVTAEGATATEEFIAALEAADPAPAFAAVILPLLRAELDPPLDAASVTFESPTKAWAPSLGARIGFEKTGKGWLAAMPEFPASADVVIQRAQAVTQVMQEATRILKDASLAPADRDVQLAEALKGLMPGAQATPAESDEE